MAKIDRPLVNDLIGRRSLVRQFALFQRLAFRTPPGQQLEHQERHWMMSCVAREFSMGVNRDARLHLIPQVEGRRRADLQAQFHVRHGLLGEVIREIRMSLVQQVNHRNL